MTLFKVFGWWSNVAYRYESWVLGLIWNDICPAQHISKSLYSTEACIPEFSNGECMMPSILKISYEEKWSPYAMLTSIVSDVHQSQRSCCLTRRSLRILALWEDNSFKCSSQHRSKQIQTSPLIHTSLECSSLKYEIMWNRSGGKFKVHLSTSDYHSRTLKLFQSIFRNCNYSNLMLPGTYADIIDENQTPPLHVSLNNSVTGPYLIEGNVQLGSDFAK